MQYTRFRIKTIKQIWSYYTRRANRIFLMTEYTANNDVLTRSWVQPFSPEPKKHTFNRLFVFFLDHNFRRHTFLMKNNRTQETLAYYVEYYV